MPQVSRTLNAVTAPKLMGQAVTWDKSVMMGTRFVGIVAILAAAYYYRCALLPGRSVVTSRRMVPATSSLNHGANPCAASRSFF